MSRTSQRSTFRVIAALVVPLYRSVARPQWRGRENIPPSGGFVVVSNHLTEIDPITVAHGVYRAGVMPRFLAKESLFRVPVFGALLFHIGQVPVYRGTARAKDSLTAAFAELESGGAIIVYPEGTITTDPDMWPMRGRTGAARLALQAGVPVVPMVHWGDQEILYRDPQGRRSVNLFPPKRVRGVIGAPLGASDLVPSGLAVPGEPSVEELAAATSTIMDTITRLLSELRGEPAPREPYDPRGGAPSSDDGGERPAGDDLGDAGGSVAR